MSINRTYQQLRDFCKELKISVETTERIETLIERDDLKYGTLVYKMSGLIGIENTKKVLEYIDYLE